MRFAHRRGVIRRQARSILLDPYANAFQFNSSTSSPWANDKRFPNMTNGLWCDLACDVWLVTRDVHLDVSRVTLVVLRVTCGLWQLFLFCDVQQGRQV